MEELMLSLFNQKISFTFDGVDIVVGNYNTSFYGVIDTVVSYDNTSREYQVSYGTKGYPYLKDFDNADEVVEFIKEIHY